jgi:hypothetical protein
MMTQQFDIANIDDPECLKLKDGTVLDDAALVETMKRSTTDDVAPVDCCEDDSGL